MTYVIVGILVACTIAIVVDAWVFGLFQTEQCKVVDRANTIERRATNRIARLQQIQKNARLQLTRHDELMDAYLEEVAELCGVADTSGWRKEICNEIVYCNRDPRQVMEDLEYGTR